MKIKLRSLLFGQADRLDDSAGSLGPLASHKSAFVKNLDMIFVISVKVDKQLSSVLKSSCFFFFRLLSKVKAYFSSPVSLRE